MSNVKIELNSAGVREMLRSPEMKALCAERAAVVRDRCGPGYASDSYTGRNRVNASVWPETAEAKVENEQNNTLLKALR